MLSVTAGGQVYKVSRFPHIRGRGEMRSGLRVVLVYKLPDICFNIAEELRGHARDAAGDRRVRLFQGSHAESRCRTTWLVRVGL